MDFTRACHLRDTGVLNEAEFGEVVKSIVKQRRQQQNIEAPVAAPVINNFAPVRKGKKKRRGKNRFAGFAPGEGPRRNALRPIVKWVFDVELFRKMTPIYTPNGNGEDMNAPLVLDMADKCISYMSHDPFLAEQIKTVMERSIEALVENRRNNVKNSRKPPKPGAKKKDPLKPIYATKKWFTVTASDGTLTTIPPPEPLPLATGDMSTVTTTVDDDSLDDKLLDDPSDRTTSQSADKSTSQSPDVQREIVSAETKRIMELERELNLLRQQQAAKQAKPHAVIDIAGSQTPTQTCAPNTTTTRTAIKQEQDWLKNDEDICVNPTRKLNLLRQKEQASQQAKSRAVVDIAGSQTPVQTRTPNTTTAHNIRQEQDWLQTAEDACVNATRNTTHNTSEKQNIICFSCHEPCLSKLAKPEGAHSHLCTFTTQTLNPLQKHTNYMHIVSYTFVPRECIAGGNVQHCPRCWPARKERLLRFTRHNNKRKKGKETNSTTANKRAKKSETTTGATPQTPSKTGKAGKTTTPSVPKPRNNRRKKSNRYKVDEIVMAKWDKTTGDQKFHAQVLRIKEGRKNNFMYDLFYMDGDSKDDVEEKNIYKLSSRRAKDPLIGKSFCDPGDYEPGVTVKKTDFNKGEFVVLTKDGRSSYWCERVTGDGKNNGKRCVESFGIDWMLPLIKKYETE